MGSPSLALSLVLAVPALAFADRPFEERRDATHVVVGKVVKVTHRDEKYNRHFEVEIAIEKVEKGEGLKEVLKAHCYQPRKDLPKPKTEEEAKERALHIDGGHNRVPIPGDRVRVFVRLRKDTYAGVFPDWLDLLPPPAGPIADKDLPNWLSKRIADWQPAKEEKRFDEIGWAKDIREAQRLAKEHGRPVFLFSHDGRMNIGRC
jgi:hypothetical protein